MQKTLQTKDEFPEHHPEMKFLFVVLDAFVRMKGNGVLVISVIFCDNISAKLCSQTQAAPHMGLKVIDLGHPTAPTS